MKNRKRLTYKDFKRYFSNHLQNKEKHDFEERMMQDAFEEEAYEGLSNLSVEEHTNDIDALKEGIRKRTKRRNRLVPVWFRYAASVLLLLGIGVSVYLINDLPEQENQIMEEISQKQIREENTEQTQPVSNKETKKEDFIAPTEKEEVTSSPSVSDQAKTTPPQPQKPTMQNEPLIQAEKDNVPPRDRKSSIKEKEAPEVSGEIAIADGEISRDISKSEVQPKETSQNQSKAQLKGAVAGIDISRNKEKADQGEKLTIRGYSTTTDSLQPLVVVDGIPQPGPLSHLKAENIETLTVYKGRTARALFGSSGQNGVILISTKTSSKANKKTDSVAKHLTKRPKTSSPDVITFKNSGFQVISGKVLSCRDSSRINGASVYFEQLPALRTSTNRMGKFNLIRPLAKDYQKLRITHARYKTQVVQIKDTTNFVITLKPLK